MNPLFARKASHPGGLIGSILDQQQPSQNVSYGPPLMGVDHILMEHLLAAGLGDKGPRVHPINWVPSRWPMPPGIVPDPEPTRLPMSEQMRAVPYLNEIGALLDRR